MNLITDSELIMAPSSDFLERITVYEVTVEMSKGSRMKESQQTKMRYSIWQNS